MFERVSAAIADQLNIDKSVITPETRLIEDLKADSLDIVAMIMEVEQEFDIQIPDEDMLGLRTVGDIILYLQDKA